MTARTAVGSVVLSAVGFPVFSNQLCDLGGGVGIDIPSLRDTPGVVRCCSVARIGTIRT